MYLHKNHVLHNGIIHDICQLAWFNYAIKAPFPQLHYSLSSHVWVKVQIEIQFHWVFVNIHSFKNSSAWTTDEIVKFSYPLGRVKFLFTPLSFEFNLRKSTLMFPTKQRKYSSYVSASHDNKRKNTFTCPRAPSNFILTVTKDEKTFSLPC